MTDDVAILRVENDRLRDLLIEYDIDPDPAPPEPEQFGPPTEWAWRMRKLFARSAAHAAVDLMRQTEAVRHLSGNQWDAPAGKIGSTLRIRLPNNFTVTQ